MHTIDELIGLTLTACYQREDSIIFEQDTTRAWKLYHQQECCESVHIEDICGDLNDLIGSPIIQAEEITTYSSDKTWPPPKSDENFTWTFYRLATANGFVTIRFHGESNGHYSETVDFKYIGITP